jgi:hypothetical protein
VARLVDEAHGSPVHGEGAKSVPHFHEAAITANGHGNGSRGDTDTDTDADPVPVAPAAPPAPVEGQAEPASWPPPLWPPTGNPSAGGTEGPVTP